MIVKNSRQDVIIDLPSDIKRIGLLMSGGTDSSILGYILCKYAAENDRIFIPITNDRETKPCMDFAKRIVEFYKESFPNLQVHEHIELVTKKEDDESRIPIIGAALDELFRDGIIDIVYTAKTENPPDFVFESRHGELLVGENDREKDRELKELFQYAELPEDSYHESIQIQMPFRNIHKKGVCELYETLGVLDTLFPLTRSCVAGLAEATNNFTTHCKDCWWCHERNWGFGTYNNMYDEAQK